MDYLITIAGLALLLAGGEGMVRGALGIARRARISPMVVGLTIVGFGTSAPELVVSVDAALSGIPGLAVGNVIGSNIANMMLIVGTAAIIAPLAVHRSVLIRDSAVMVGATLLFVAIALSGTAVCPTGSASSFWRHWWALPPWSRDPDLPLWAPAPSPGSTVFRRS